MRAIHAIHHSVRAVDTINPIGPRLFISLPVCQDVLDLRRVRQSVNILKVFLCDLERPSSDIRDVFPDQLAGIDGGLVDLLKQEASEGFDS